MIKVGCLRPTWFDYVVVFKYKKYPKIYSLASMCLNFGDYLSIEWK